MSQEIDPELHILIENIELGITRMAVALETIAEIVKKGGADDKPQQQVAVDESMGSCPECESTEVEQKGRYPAAIYHCTKCNHLWVNSAEAFFKDD